MIFNAMALLSSHYRQALDWNDNVIHQSKKLLDKLYGLLDEIKDINSLEDNDLSDEFVSPLFDDLNTPGLIANLNKLIKDYHSASEEELPIIKANLIRAMNLIGVCQSSYDDTVTS